MQNNLHGPFSRRRILFLNLLVKVLPYLPMNGNRVHILGRLSRVAVSVSDNDFKLDLNVLQDKH